MRAVIALGSLLSLTSPTLSQTPAPGDPVVSLTRLATCQGVNAHQETIAATFDSAAAAAQARRAEALDQLYEETIVRAIAAAVSPDLPLEMLRPLVVATYARTRLLLTQEFKGAADDADDGEKIMAGHVGMVAVEAAKCDNLLADAASD